MTKKTRKTHKMRKVLLTVCCTALLVCVTIGATVAYLTSTDTVTNTFTVGNVKIKLDEAKVNDAGKPVNDAGTVVDVANAPRVAENTYKLMPGHTYTKDPTVTVEAKSEECYVRVLVTINEQKDLDKVFDPGIALNTVLTGSSANWEYVKDSVDLTKNTRTYELRYKNTIAASDTDTKLDPVFQNVVMPGDLTNDDLKAIEGLKITVVAQAIQADGFLTADAAWTAFDQQA